MSEKDPITKKQYLYHKVPEEMMSNEAGQKVLFPLNVLEKKFPELYKVKVVKYKWSEQEDPEQKRKSVPDRFIPTLDATWGDVIHLTAIHPEDLKDALVEAGFEPQEMKFYQIDPELLDKENTTIYLYKEDVDDESPENFAPYDPEKLEEHAMISE